MGLSVLRTSIPVDPLAGKYISNAKRSFVALAVVALTISALDLMNVPLLKTAGAYLRDDQQRRMTALLVSPLVAIAPDPALKSPPIRLASYSPGALSALEMTTASIPPTESIVRLPSPGERLHLTGALLDKAQRCLANAIYYEARAEPARGQSAVAQVIMNRVFSGHFPDDVCDVVYQNNANQRCQFAFACSAKRKTIGERGAWARANRIAARTLAGDLYDPAIGTSTHFHAAYLHPDWVREMRKVVRYGTHTFYRPIAWGSGANKPVWGPKDAAQAIPSAR
jgi:hypothetical protein